MSSNNENSTQKDCIGGNALATLLTSYDREQIHDAFDDMDKMFKEWLYSDFADDKESRHLFLFSLEIILELGEVVKSIPKKKIKQLKEQLAETINAVKEA